MRQTTIDKSLEPEDRERATACASRSSKSNFEPSNLVELLCRRALESPHRRAYIFLANGETEEVNLTYGELHTRARAIGARLQSLEAAGERALLLYPPGLDYIAAFFGCLYAGVIAVPA
jgi:acyl-CoA synthetase (AMP-forming)/AMP-acid ligase II